MSGLISSFKNFLYGNKQPNSDDIQYGVEVGNSSLINDPIVKKFNLKDNEYVNKIDDIQQPIYYVEDGYAQSKIKVGTAIITNFSLQFKETAEDGFSALSIVIPLYSILRLEKLEDKNSQEIYYLEIITKDNRFIKFRIDSDKRKFFLALNTKAFPKETCIFSNYAREFCQSSASYFKDNNGWNIYIPSNEFARQRLDLSRFELAKINEQFQVCGTYPELLVIPKSIKKDKIIEASSFRTKSRFPVVCWYNRKNKTTMLRSSQTKSGFINNRSEADEKYLEEVRGENEKLDIFDARPYLNAWANRVS